MKNRYYLGMLLCLGLVLNATYLGSSETSEDSNKVSFMFEDASQAGKDFRRQTEDNIFTLEVLGHIGGMYLLPLPVPLGYNGTIAPADVPGHKAVVFRLIHNSSISCNITKLKLWQSATTYGKTWNVSGVINVSPPTSMLTQGDYFDFFVNLINTSRSFMLFYPIWIYVETENLGAFLVSTGSSGLGKELSTWQVPSSSLPKLSTNSSSSISTSLSTNSSSIPFTPGFLWFVTPLVGLILILLRKSRTKE